MGRRFVAPQAAVATPDRPDGVYGRTAVVFRGREHVCELTAKEAAFLDVALKEPEIDVHRLMHLRSGLAFKEHYRNDRSKRNKLSQFLSRLGVKLSAAKPPIPLRFSLPRDGDLILRRDPASPPLR